jgi:UDP-N-acetyl-D-glucosamine dehydrogenase
MGLLHEKGALVSYTDPHVPHVDAKEWTGNKAIESVNAGPGSFGRYDCVVIVTDHRSFDYKALVAEADLVVDTRNAIKERAPHVFRLGAPQPATQGVNVSV